MQLKSFSVTCVLTKNRSVAGLSIKILTETIPVLNKIFCINGDTNDNTNNSQSSYYDGIVEGHFVSIATVEHL